MRQPLRSVEQLEPRNLFAVGALSPLKLVSLDPPPVAIQQDFELDLPSGALASDYRVALSNNSNVDARFAMTFNGKISKNNADLVHQIRASVEEDETEQHAVYRWFRDNVVHDFPLTGKFWQHDAGVFLNSFGFGLCDDLASAQTLVWRAMGYDARVWLLDGHVVSEVYADGRWEMYDPDLEVFYYNDLGQVAGVEEIAANPDLITNPLARPLKPVSRLNSVYSGRMAQIYGTQENNKVCTVCTTVGASDDLYFQIPAGGSLSFGEALQAEAPVVAENAPELSRFSNYMKLTVPPRWSGTLDIPLAIADIQGEANDAIHIGGQSFFVGSDAMDGFLKEDTVSGNRLHSITFGDNQSSVDVLFFFNANYGEIFAENELSVWHQTSDGPELQVELQHIEPAATGGDWQFELNDSKYAYDSSGNGHHGFVRGRYQSSGGEAHLNGYTQYADLPNFDFQAVVDTGKFDVEATIELDAQTGTRRPIFDTFRFVLEIDQEGKPHAFYKTESGIWQSVRGADPLSAGTQHQLRVSYDVESREFLLFADGDLVGERFAFDMSEDYTMKPAKIGASDHMGGLFFAGDIDRVTVTPGDVAVPVVNEIALAPAPDLMQPDDEASSLDESRTSGDADGDGQVAFADFLTLSGNFGMQVDAVWEDGDFNADGSVAFADFLLLSGNFGATG